MKIWNDKTRSISALNKVNIRRLGIMLYECRMTPKYVKLTRRSRRRMRGKGGCWYYPPEMLKQYRDYFGKVMEGKVEG